MPANDQNRLKKQHENPRIVALWKALQPLKSCASFMNTGAHPDDETTPMLAAMALRDGIRVSHACSTRGEGGQNALGTETTKDLGVIRTREMERAAAVIGFTQYWHSETPEDTIFDFGFSKHGDETLGKWDEQRVLRRFVQIIRRERPDIVCPTFLDIPGQHGHHRAMTRSAFRAVEMAADETAFSQLDLPVWQVKKLYLPAWSGAGDAYDDDVPPPPATVTFDATGGDPVLGADYAQVAQWSRRFHATQGMGRWVEPGAPSVWPLHLAWVPNGQTRAEQSILDNLPGGLSDLADFADAPAIKAHLKAAGESIDNAIAAFPDYSTIAEHALAAIGRIADAEKSCPCKAANEVLHRLALKQRQIANVLALTSDLRGMLEFSTSEIRPGDTFTAYLSLHDQGLSVEYKLLLPDGWKATLWDDGKCQITVAKDAPGSNPYPDTWHPDRTNSQISVRLSWQMEGRTIATHLDPLKPLTVLPGHSASFSRTDAILRLSDLGPISVELKDVYPASAKASIQVPSGWHSSIDQSTIHLQPDATVIPGLYEFPLSLDGQATSTIRKMYYDHVGSLTRTEPAVIRVLVLEIDLPAGRIAYVGGGSDNIDQHLRAVGMEINSLTDAQLVNMDFGNFDTILIGIFAFRTRPTLAARLGQLHDWVKAGGNLVTLYHRPWDNWDPDITPPAHLKIGKPSLRWRVTDENAAVSYLQSAHPLLNHPNQIGMDDWTGWHKERGLYFAADWDAVYEPLLSTSDKGEEPLTGSLLCAQIGYGQHIHTSLILHHQIEMMVPGAFRLMANFLGSEGLK